MPRRRSSTPEESQEILASQEVHDIAVALGVDPASSDLSGLRYSKVCILADADSDGLHIATLLCALFVRHFPALVRAGHVFVAMPPLFRIDVGKDVYYALDESEKQGHLDQIAADRKKGKISVQRFKGLGEMNPIQLRETTMAPDTRRLVRLTMDSETETIQLLDMLLARTRAPDRKAWLERKGDQADLAVERRSQPQPVELEGCPMSESEPLIDPNGAQNATALRVHGEGVSRSPCTSKRSRAASCRRWSEAGLHASSTP